MTRLAELASSFFAAFFVLALVVASVALTTAGAAEPLSSDYCSAGDNTCSKAGGIYCDEPGDVWCDETEQGNCYCYEEPVPPPYGPKECVCD